MNVIFVSYFDFNTPSGMHIFHLANALSRQGVRCAAYTPGNAQSVSRYGKPLFQAFDRTLSPRRLLAECDFSPAETLIHCWTPRETARRIAMELRELTGSSVVIHMEDNEKAIAEAHLAGVPERERDNEELWKPGSSLHGISHPVRHREFLASAAGYTCIIESLLEFKPENVPGHVFWPSCEPEVFDIPPESSPEEKARWGIAPDENVIFYPGNLHLNNAEEVIQLYAAVSRLRMAGMRLRIIRFGKYIPDAVALFDGTPALAGGIVDLTGKITQAEVPAVMRAADYLVQPGRDDAFNRYRFPSKLPLFMASGRPVVLPKSNLGTHLADGENCLLLPDCECCTEGITERILFLAQNPEKAKAIGAAGREFAKEHFSWKKSARGLREFYASILAAR